MTTAKVEALRASGGEVSGRDVKMAEAAEEDGDEDLDRAENVLVPEEDGGDDGESADEEE